MGSQVVRAGTMSWSDGEVSWSAGRWAADADVGQHPGWVSRACFRKTSHAKLHVVTLRTYLQIGSTGPDQRGPFCIKVICSYMHSTLRAHLQIGSTGPDQRRPFCIKVICTTPLGNISKLAQWGLVKEELFIKMVSTAHFGHISRLDHQSLITDKLFWIKVISKTSLGHISRLAQKGLIKENLLY